MNPAIAAPFLTRKRIITLSGQQQMETWVQNHVMGVPVTSSSWENSTRLTVLKQRSHWQCPDFHCLDNINRSLTTSSSRIKRKANVLAAVSKSMERLIKAPECYLSTTASPIAGVLFISTEKVTFCSERMIKLSSSDVGSVRVLYKVAIPLAKTETVNESKNMKRPTLKFTQIVTVDKFDFWFMGFLNYQKSFKCLLQVINQA